MTRYRGLLLMICAVAVFAVQDGVSKRLASDYPALVVVMIRYWGFGLFVLVAAAFRPGGVARAARSSRPWVQITRGVLLAVEVVVMTASFAWLGLAASHALFAICPLLAALLAALFLGERVDAWRWGAIGAGFIGVIVLVRPGSGLFEPLALLPLLCAVGFAGYVVLTRWVSRFDTNEVSQFYTAVAGAAVLTLVGPFFWVTPAVADLPWFLCLCLIGIAGHSLLIAAYALSEASSLQPFAYVQLVLSSGVGIVFFGEVLTASMVVGAAIITAAGLVSFWRQARQF